MARTADTPLQQVSYQLARASLARRVKDIPAVVDAYQRLIQDDTAGSVRLRTSDGTITAAELAVAQIEQLIQTHDRSVYEAVESRAEAALASARTTNDVRGLLGVRSSFPNSRAGQEAIGLAMKASIAGDGQSIGLLRQLGAAPLDTAQRQQLQRALLQADVGRGDVHSALGRARALAQLDPDASVAGLPQLNGRSLGATSVRQLIDVLQALAFEAEDRALADLNVPDSEPLLDLERPVTTRGVKTILVPSNPRRDRVRTAVRSRFSRRQAPRRSPPSKRRRSTNLPPPPGGGKTSRSWPPRRS
jgi:hypothetical protein